MDSFLIGMFGGFDEIKYRRDLRPGFFGVEACMFANNQAVDELVRKAAEGGFSFGVHYPLVRKDTTYRDPFLLHPDAEVREQDWERFENEAAYAAEKGALYILTHFPKPVLVNRSLDLTYWRFGGEKEWMFAEAYPAGLFKENLEVMFERLCVISDKYGIRIVLENDAISAALAEGSLLTDLLEKYDKVKICLDIGRLHLQEKLDSSFKGLDFTQKLAPYTYLVHLWNTNPAQNLSGGHFPVLPGQKPSEGWADVRMFMDIIKRNNRKVKVLFEHRSDLVSDDELDECYRWVEQLLRE